jgi:hypothetical protein
MVFGGKPLGPLLHFTVMLPFIMKNFRNFTDCPLRKNTENTPKHHGHMHSHVPINVETNSANREGKINVPQSYTLQTLT